MIDTTKLHSSIPVVNDPENAGTSSLFFSKIIRLVWIKYAELPRPVGLLKLMLDLVHMINTFPSKSTWVAFHVLIKYFGQPFSVTWPVYRNISAGESSLGVGLKRIYISSVRLEWHAHEPKT